MPYKVVKSEQKYKGRIVDVVLDEITLPNGKTTFREIVVRGRAAAIVPVDDNGLITFVKQYRHGAKSIVLEIPAGMVDDGEDPLKCAVRELEEETGLIAGKIKKIFDIHVSVGYCTEIITIFLAEDLSKGIQNFDADEFIEVERYSFEEITSLILNGEITDSKTICGVLAARELLHGEKSGAVL